MWLASAASSFVPGAVRLFAERDRSLLARAVIVGGTTTRGPPRLLITADAGGANGYRTRAWRSELGARICHLPPGSRPSVYGPRVRPLCCARSELSYG
ncbi:hypothetical protein DC008_10610 [Streptomyces nigra]|nr:hypothetical protein DC008_10610 [Streptomyces nigra]